MTCDQPSETDKDFEYEKLSKLISGWLTMRGTSVEDFDKHMF